MQAIVLAGGYATRLWPITRNRPKMLLPIGVGENTVIGTTLDTLERDDRIDDVYVSTNEKFADEFDAFQNTGAPTIAAYDVDSYDRAASYGLVELDDDNEVVDFQEKPDDPKSTLVSIACYAFRGEDLPKLEQYLAADNNPDEPGLFVQWLQARETVRAYTFGSGGSSEARSARSRTGSEATRETEAWFDIGTPEGYLDAIAWHLGGQNDVHQSAELHDVDLGENVQIMPGAELADTAIDDSVVFPDATLRDCDVRRSLVDEDTLVESLKLSGAVVGAHTRMNGKL